MEGCWKNYKEDTSQNCESRVVGSIAVLYMDARNGCQVSMCNSWNPPKIYAGHGFVL